MPFSSSTSLRAPAFRLTAMLLGYLLTAFGLLQFVIPSHLLPIAFIAGGVLLVQLAAPRPASARRHVWFEALLLTIIFCFFPFVVMAFTSAVHWDARWPVVTSLFLPLLLDATVQLRRLTPAFR